MHTSCNLVHVVHENNMYMYINDILYKGNVQIYKLKHAELILSTSILANYANINISEIAPCIQRDAAKDIKIACG